MKEVFTVYGGARQRDRRESPAPARCSATHAAGFILVLLSSGTTWLMGSDRSQAVAGYDGAGPRVLGTFSAKYGTPIVVNFLSRRRLDDRHGAAFQLSGGNARSTSTPC